MWFYVLFGFFFLNRFRSTQEVASLSVSTSQHLSLLSLGSSEGFLFVCFCLLFLFSSVSGSLAPSLLSDGLWFALLNTLPSPPLPSPVNKQPEPAPRRTSVLNRKQSPLTSPTFQPPLPPLEAGTPTQLESHPPPPPSEAEQPGLSVAGSGGGGGGGLVGGVQVATVQHQVVTQLSTEESR